MGSSVLAACGNGSDSGGSTGPVGQAVSAFVRGKWRVDAVWRGGVPSTFLVKITASNWTVEPGEHGAWPNAAREWNGQWALQGTRLTLKGPWRPGEPGVMRKWAALDVPGKIVEAESSRLIWKIYGGVSPDIDELRVRYAKGALHIVHIDGDGRNRTDFTCTRA
ncbi:hypothetical protein [Streptomyces sp. 3N207]|uniref:hypothetical protein n=1 Tax=Streptomyces sp. 3N207 TaxID=3457417 RepID=UPI003FD64E7B